MAPRIKSMPDSELSGVSVRLLQEGDLAAVLDLERTTPGAPHWSAKDYQQCLGGMQGTLVRRAWVAERTGSVVGFAVVREMALDGALDGALECELESIVVHPEEQGCGVGGTLLRTIIDSLKSSGATVLMLEVRASNQAALHLYERAGMVRVGARPGYYSGPPEDAVLLQMEF